MQLAGLLLEESTQRLNEKDIDRVLFETSTVVREAVLEGMRDLAAGRVISARDYVARRFGKKSKLEKKHG